MEKPSLTISVSSADVAPPVVDHAEQPKYQLSSVTNNTAKPQKIPSAEADEYPKEKKSFLNLFKNVKNLPTKRELTQQARLVENMRNVVSVLMKPENIEQEGMLRIPANKTQLDDCVKKVMTKTVDLEKLTQLVREERHSCAQWMFKTNHQYYVFYSG